MSGRDSSRGPEPDDWFGQPGDAPRSGTPAGIGAAGDVTVQEQARSAASDDWLSEEVAAGGDVRAGQRLIGKRRGVALAVGAGAVVFLVVGLAVGGVFSGGGKHPATTPPTAPTTNQTPSTPATKPTPATPPAPTTTLKPGDQGAQVKLLQRTLTRLGYATGAIDGDYGLSTQSALTSFQRASTLAADGVLGPKTLAALRKASRTHR